MTEAPPLPALTKEHIVRQQRLQLADRVFELEADNALLEQDLAAARQRIVELEAALAGKTIEPKAPAAPARLIA